MKTAKKIIIVLFIGILVFSCGGKKELSEEEKQIIQLEEKLEASPSDLDTKEALIHAYFGQNQVEKLIELFEANEDAFADNIIVRASYGASLCKMADMQKEATQMLVWVKKGMIYLEKLVEAFPDSKTAYIWRAITYSNFPSILGARGITEQDVAFLLKEAASGKWSLSEDDYNLLFESLLNVAVNYEDKAFYEASYKDLENTLSNKEARVFKYYESKKKFFSELK